MSISRMMAGVGAFRAWDISTANYVRGFSISAQYATPTGVFFKPDGTKLFVLGEPSDYVSQYTLSTPWDVSSASYSSNFLVPGGVILEDISFKPDGTKMYVLDEAVPDIEEYTLSSPWDVTSASFSARRAETSLTSPRGMFFKPDGTKFFLIQSSLREYSMSVPWDLSSASFAQSIVHGPQRGYAIFFKPDGKKMYLSVGQFNPTSLVEYNLSTPWDISTATITHSFNYDGDRTYGEGIFFRQDGKRLYVASNQADSIDEYVIGNAARSQTFITAGTHSFSVPSGVTSVNLRLEGGAGGGASGGTSVIGEKNPVTTNYYGGDGGSGALATKVLSVTPLETLTIVVGAGGAGGAAPNAPNVGVNSGSDGTDSTVTQSASVVARADAGSGAPSVSDGAGGLAASSTGDTAADGVAGAGGAGGFSDSQAGQAGTAGFVTITW